MPSAIPLEDAPCLAALQNLSFYLSEDPAAYATSSGDAANLASLVSAYQAALTTANTVGTRTKDTILLKDQAKAEAVSFARAIINLVKPNMGVADDAKVRAGIPLPRVGPGTPRPIPSTQPVLDIVGSTKGSQTLNFHDTLEPTRRAKPFGVSGLYLYRVISDAPVSSPEGAQLYKGFTKGPIGVAFEPEDNGKTCTYFACWINSKLEEGPLSNPVSMLIAA